eukprot:Sspe_Gene.69114::Locus_40739_Transcript_1_1_Confidence_1.000_Length_2241::g.69114::m.69114
MEKQPYATPSMAETVARGFNSDIIFMGKTGVLKDLGSEGKRLWPDGVQVQAVVKALNEAAQKSQRLQEVNGDVFRRYDNPKEQSIALTKKAAAKLKATAQATATGAPKAMLTSKGNELQNRLNKLNSVKYSGESMLCKSIEKTAAKDDFRGVKCSAYMCHAAHSYKELKVPIEYIDRKYSREPNPLSRFKGPMWKLPCCVRQEPNPTSWVFIDYRDLYITKRTRAFMDDLHQVHELRHAQEVMQTHAFNTYAFWICGNWLRFQKCSYFENCHFIHVDKDKLEEACQSCFCNGDDWCPSYQGVECPLVHSRDQILAPKWWTDTPAASESTIIIQFWCSGKEYRVETSRQLVYTTVGSRDVEQRWCSSPDCYLWAWCRKVHIRPEFVAQDVVQEPAVREEVNAYIAKTKWFRDKCVPKEERWKGTKKTATAAASARVPATGTMAADLKERHGTLKGKTWATPTGSPGGTPLTTIATKKKKKEESREFSFEGLEQPSTDYSTLNGHDDREKVEPPTPTTSASTPKQTQTDEMRESEAPGTPLSARREDIAQLQEKVDDLAKENMVLKKELADEKRKKTVNAVQEMEYTRKDHVRLHEMTSFFDADLAGLPLYELTNYHKMAMEFSHRIAMELSRRSGKVHQQNFTVLPNAVNVQNHYPGLAPTQAHSFTFNQSYSDVGNGRKEEWRSEQPQWNSSGHKRGAEVLPPHLMSHEEV